MKKNFAGLLIILIIFSSSVFVFFTFFDGKPASNTEDNSTSGEVPDDPSENPGDSSETGGSNEPGDNVDEETITDSNDAWNETSGGEAVSPGNNSVSAENETPVEGRYDPSLEILVPQEAFPAFVPYTVWLDMGVPTDVTVVSYRVASHNVSELREWYLEFMTNGTLIGEGTFEDPSSGTLLSHLLFQENDEGILLLFMRNERVLSNAVALGLVRDEWIRFEDYIDEVETDPDDGSFDNGSIEVLFYDYLDLPDGNVTFSTLPLSMDAFTWIWPLGHLDPMVGHTFPISFGMFELADPESYPPHHEVAIPYDGIIVEVTWHEREWPVGGRFTGTYNDYDIKIAHTKDIVSSLGHISELSSSFLSKTGELKPGVNQLEIPVSEGEKIGFTGGRPRAQYTMNWRVFDRNIAHFINPDRYGLGAHEAHFIEYCTESLQDVLYSKLIRTSEPKFGVSDFDELGTLAGNWFHTDVNQSDPMADWTKHLAFVYAVDDPESVRVSIGGTLPVEIGVYSVQGNMPDPRFVTVESESVIMRLESAPEWEGRGLQKITLLIELIGDMSIKVEVFQGWIGNPIFTDNALIFTR